MRTRDGRLRVYLYADQTGEISNDKGVLLTGRMPIYRIGEDLAERGVAWDELVED